MPQFSISTNVPRANIPAGFVKDLSALVGRMAGKPESYVAIAINADQIMSFGGSTEPCAVCTFGNIGSIDNAKFSKQVMDKIGKDLGVPAGRMYIFFSSSSGNNVGHNGGTF